MDCTLSATEATFHLHQRVVGIYRLDDPCKPHFRSLRTPLGHETVVVSPGDHPHHKGLMYALRCDDLNFWEEQSDDGPIGVQESLAVTAVPGGLRQELLWRAASGGLETYRETRTLTATPRADGAALVWEWHTRRKALRDHCLSQSPWALQLPDGRRINYHGLGLRPPWMWRFPGAWAGAVEMDGVKVDPLEACGTNGPRMGLWGLIDGQPARTRAAVTIEQSQTFTWFVLKGDFPFLAVGPSNASAVPVARGDNVEEHYRITVEDRPGT
jgi:hypothetical protein